MYPVFPVEAARDELVASLKSIILSRLGLTEVEGKVLSVSLLSLFTFPSLFITLSLALPFPSHCLIAKLLC